MIKGRATLSIFPLPPPPSDHHSLPPPLPCRARVIRRVHRVCTYAAAAARVILPGRHSARPPVGGYTLRGSAGGRSTGHDTRGHAVYKHTHTHTRTYRMHCRRRCNPIRLIAIAGRLTQKSTRTPSAAGPRRHWVARRRRS